jgi:hypothetical protein
MVYGNKDTKRLKVEIPACVFILSGNHRQMIKKLEEANIYAKDWNYYGQDLTMRLGLDGDGGVSRVGPVPYKSVEAIRLWAGAENDS